MSNYTSTGNTSNQTLTASTVDVVTLNSNYPYVEVVNRDTSADLWFTVDSGPTGAQTSLTPTVGGDGCYYVGPGGSRIVADDVTSYQGGTSLHVAPASVVRLISASAIAYSVTGIPAATV